MSRRHKRRSKEAATRPPEVTGIARLLSELPVATLDLHRYTGAQARPRVRDMLDGGRPASTDHRRSQLVRGAQRTPARQLERLSPGEENPMSNDPVTVAPHIYKPLIENGSGSDAVGEREPNGRIGRACAVPVPRLTWRWRGGHADHSSSGRGADHALHLVGACRSLTEKALSPNHPTPPTTRPTLQDFPPERRHKPWCRDRPASPNFRVAEPPTGHRPALHEAEDQEPVSCVDVSVTIDVGLIDEALIGGVAITEPIPECFGSIGSRKNAGAVRITPDHPPL